MDLTRRELVAAGGLSLLGSSLLPVWLRPARAAARADEPLLVVAFLRGAADSLHLVPPRGDKQYERARGALTIRESSAFGPDFGLHPALAGAAPLVERAQLAVVLNAGTPGATRSHFEAQDMMEAGEPGSMRLSDGWLARALGAEDDRDDLATLAITNQLPLSLRGSGAFAIGGDFGLQGATPGARARLAALYSAEPGPLGAAGTRALEALDRFRRLGRRARGEGRRLRGRRKDRLHQGAKQLLELERLGLPVRAVFLESTGWDTHQNQGTVRGQMAGWIQDLGDAMGELASGLGERRDWLLVVMTEFGRTVRPNGSGGTDHGSGSAMFVAGPRVRGGVYGEWRGLGEEALFDGRDLPVTTDYRSVVSEVLRAHLDGPPPADTFPGFAPTPLGLIA